LELGALANDWGGVSCPVAIGGAEAAPGPSVVAPTAGMPVGAVMPSNVLPTLAPSAPGCSTAVELREAWLMAGVPVTGVVRGVLCPLIGGRDPSEPVTAPTLGVGGIAGPCEIPPRRVRLGSKPAVAWLAVRGDLAAWAGGGFEPLGTRFGEGALDGCASRRGAGMPIIVRCMFGLG